MVKRAVGGRHPQQLLAEGSAASRHKLMPAQVTPLKGEVGHELGSPAWSIQQHKYPMTRYSHSCRGHRRRPCACACGCCNGFVCCLLLFVVAVLVVVVVAVIDGVLPAEAKSQPPSITGR